MTTNRIIPSLLLRDGRLVKGVRFSDYRDAGAPATTCRAHSAQGADEISIVDIDATRLGREPDFAMLQSISREIQVPLTFSGGIANVSYAHRAMESGADKIGINTTALDRPDLIEELAHIYGAQAVVIGIDVVRRNKDMHLYDHRTRKILKKPNLRDWVRTVTERGAGEIRVVAVDREGTREGFDVPLWRAVRDLTDVPIILEGGAGSLGHIADAMKAGVDSVGLGTMLVFSDNNLVKVRRYLESAGLPMRP
jgi:imidazole glycerol-phosphate synthase subunit HisF